MAVTKTKKARKVAKRKPAARKAAKPKTAKAKPAKRSPEPDFSALPPESVTRTTRSICLACVLDVFTRHMGLAPRTAYAEIKRYTPSVAELTALPARPYFELQDRCPYCDSPAKWHAALEVHRIESGKATDAPRRKLIGSLPSSGQFEVLEEKATHQHAFFDWLEKISKELDLENPLWLLEVTRHYLGRKEPKVDWQAEFQKVRTVRRSRQLESGWEAANGRLYLTPMLFDEILLVQYLVSRSHLAGGLTFEGRYTLPELFRRLRNSNYFRAVGITAHNPADALEQAIAQMGGGEGSLRFHYVVDRREFLEKAKAIQTMPRWRARQPTSPTL